MIISLQQEKTKIGRMTLKHLSLRLINSIDAISHYFPQFGALAYEKAFSALLISALLMRYFRSDINHSHQFGKSLRDGLAAKQNELIAKSEVLAKKLAEHLLDHYFYVSAYSEIQSLPGEIVLPVNYQLLKKDGVEIHFKISAEGLQVYICLPGNHDSNHRFVQAQEITQGDAYLVNSEAIFYTHEKIFTADDIKEIMDLVQYGAAILYYRGNKKK